MAKIKKNGDDYVPQGSCFICKKPANFKDHPDPRKDFICGLCTMIMVKNPRSPGQRWEDLIPESKKDVDVDLQNELKDILRI